MRMNLNEIKSAVDAGKTVHWHNSGYTVHKDRYGDYYIIFDRNGHCTGLTHKVTGKLMEKEDEFYIEE